MSFTSEQYLLFVAFFAAIYWVIPLRWRAWFLTGCSYLFYYSWDPQMAVVMAAITLICFFGGLAIEKYSAEEKRKSTIVFALTAILIAFVVFFKALPLIGTAKDIVIPLGVSYYTFKLISYLIDLHWGQIKAERHLGRFAAFVAFFPQIVAGPIQRAESFFEQFEQARRPSLKMIAFGCSRILIGLFKKLFVAEHLLAVISPGFNNPFAVGSVDRAASFYLFSIQLYADFSALTDISNGSAMLFGLEGVENFNWPFTATSISNYWRRWHMSLTMWLTDYVFMPARMALRNLGNTGLALAITANMMLVALWHAFSWNFVVFGLIHSSVLCIDALTMQRRKRWYKRVPSAKIAAGILGWIFTYHVVALTNTMWRAHSVRDAFRIAWFPGAGWTTQVAFHGNDLYLGLAGFFFIEAIEYLRRRLWERHLLNEVPRWTRWFAYSGMAVLYLFAIVMIYSTNAPRSAFMYAGF
jgi:alginate O-acetyltransferase complex protein AlgI